MLHVVIVGGGPTGVEFAGELSNFINKVSALVSSAGTGLASMGCVSL